MFKNRFILLTTLTSLILIQIMLWGLFLNRSQLPPEVPFNYLAPWGQERLAPSSYLWYLPSIGAVFLAVNLILAHFFYKLEKFIAQLLSFATIVSNLLLTLSLLRILNLVFKWIWSSQTSISSKKVDNCLKRVDSRGIVLRLGLIQFHFLTRLIDGSTENL